MITGRQEKLLDFLVREYISTSEPVSSKALKKACDLDVCGATIRNDLQALTEEGYITQPHTSAGRIPTQKAYKYIADKLERAEQMEVKIVRTSIVRQISETHDQISRQMQQMEEIMDKLEHGDMFEILNILDNWHKKLW